LLSNFESSNDAKIKQFSGLGPSQIAYSPGHPYFLVYFFFCRGEGGGNFFQNHKLGGWKILQKRSKITQNLYENQRIRAKFEKKISLQNLLATKIINNKWKCIGIFSEIWSLPPPPTITIGRVCICVQNFKFIFIMEICFSRGWYHTPTPCTREGYKNLCPSGPLRV